MKIQIKIDQFIKLVSKFIVHNFLFRISMKIMFIGLIFPSAIYCQTLIKGHVYFYDLNESVIGYYVLFDT